MNPNIILQQTPETFGSRFEAGRRAKLEEEEHARNVMRQQQQDARLGRQDARLQRDDDDEQALKGIFNGALEAGEDGQPRLNERKLLTDLYRHNPEMAIKLDGQFSARDASRAKTQYDNELGAVNLQLKQQEYDKGLLPKQPDIGFAPNGTPYNKNEPSNIDFGTNYSVPKVPEKVDYNKPFLPDGTPNSPYQNYEATKKTTNKAGLSAAAQKELFEADETIEGSKSAIASFMQALNINDKAMGGFGSGALATAGSVLPEFIRPSTVDSTKELDNILQGAALPQLKAIFGGMPTEGERAILLEVQGSSSQPANVRKGIFERAILASEKRIKVNEDKANRLRSGTYFTNEGESLAEPAAPNPQGAILDKNAKMQPKKMNSTDSQAITWAKKNPSDPRAKTILQLHGMK